MQKIESNQTAELNDLDKVKALRFFTGIFRMARLFLGMFFIIGLGISILGVKLIWEAYESQNWPSVQGKIISPPVERESTRLKIGFRTRIQYAYEAGGKRFLGDRIALGPLVGLYGPSDKHLARKYPKETIVTVYYNPIRPEQSVLEPGFNRNIILIVIFGPLVILCSVILFGNLKKFEVSVQSKLNPPDKKDIPPKVSIQPQPPSYERTRVWIMVLLSALLVALLLVQFYGDEINKWSENIRKELGFEENSKK
jgi:hypothetical protein